MKRTLLPTLAVAALSVGLAQAQAPQATAALLDADGGEVGNVAFDATASGALHVFIEATGLPPGPHGLHIHETGTCDPESGFESAGGHLDGGMEHGHLSEGGPHPGDLPNVHVGEDGVLRVEFFVPGLSLEEGADGSLFDDDGSAIVIHADADDYQSQPSGNAGDRIACGVVEITA